MINYNRLPNVQNIFKIFTAHRTIVHFNKPNPIDQIFVSFSSKKESPPSGIRPIKFQYD